MFSSVWLLLGGFLGWWSEVLFGRRLQYPPQQEDAPSAPPGFFVGLLAGMLSGWLARGQAQAAHPPQPATAPVSGPVAAVASTPLPEKSPSGLQRRRLVYLVVLVTVLVAAFHPYLGWFSSTLYWLESLILSPRVSSLLSGALIGFWASRYRRAIAARSADFYEAFLGSETKSSWPLQSLVAIVALGFIVFAIKPELLDNLESFKAGEVEAKFANISASTRESRVTTNDLSKQVTIK